MISYQSLLSLTAETLLQRSFRVLFLLCVLLASSVITVYSMTENPEWTCGCFTFIFFIGVVISIFGIKDYDA